VTSKIIFHPIYSYLIILDFTVDLPEYPAYVIFKQHHLTK